MMPSTMITLAACCQRGSLIWVLKRSSSAMVLLIEGADGDRGAVRGDFVHRIADVARVEAHHQDRVRAPVGRLFLHALGRFDTTVREQIGVRAYLSDDKRHEPGADIAEEITAPHQHPEDFAVYFHDLVARHVVGGDHQNGIVHILIIPLGRNLAGRLSDGGTIVL